MRIVFMASAALACPSLDMLLSNPADEVVAVVTQPDRPKGRGRALCPSLVREHLSDNSIQVLTPVNVNDDSAVAEIASCKPDLIVVVAYGQILKSAVLGAPALGCINVHASLLPRYRGAAPIQWAIANGDAHSGVTTMYMDEGMDEGDIILQQEIAIEDRDTGGILHDKLAAAGAELLGRTVELVRIGEVPRQAQVSADATVARKLTKLDGRIDWTLEAREIYNRVRAFNPWPCCFCCAAGATLKVLSAEMVESVDADGSQPGDVLAWDGDGPTVAAGAGAIRLIEVKPEGRKAMAGSAYMRGRQQLQRME